MISAWLWRRCKLCGRISKMFCGINSAGRVSPSQGESREFESRIPLQKEDLRSKFMLRRFLFLGFPLYGIIVVQYHLFELEKLNRMFFVFRK
jgi:hypothetical protein